MEDEQALVEEAAAMARQAAKLATRAAQLAEEEEAAAEEEEGQDDEQAEDMPPGGGAGGGGGARAVKDIAMHGGAVGNGHSKQKHLPEEGGDQDGLHSRQHKRHRAGLSSSIVDTVRAQFPAFSRHPQHVFAENAGGSQVPRCVSEAVSEYFESKYVQLGAGYAQANEADAVIRLAHHMCELFVNGVDTGKCALGASTSAMLYFVAQAYSTVWQPGDKVIIAESAHEANVTPWLHLERQGVIDVVWWRLDPSHYTCKIEDLESLLAVSKGKVKLVCFPHVSNILGGICDAEKITDLCHRHGAKVCVDGVAYASHRAPDVAASKIDWYAYSCYKVYGPHMAALYGSHEAWEELSQHSKSFPNHGFVSNTDPVYKIELGGPSHEGCAAIVALGTYLNILRGYMEPQSSIDRAGIVEAFAQVTALELPLQQRFMEYLTNKPGVHVIGPSDSDSATRVPTFSFVHNKLAPEEIVAHLHKRNIGCRSGHMYAIRVCDALGLTHSGGVVRCSFLHYNTMKDIDRVIEALDDIL
eukprot:jgi/Chlat1/7335/Chrsp59S06966